MHGSMPRRLALALFVVGVLSHGVALAEGDVSVALTAYRVTMSQGKEAYVPAEQARPGEVIEYRAIYKNVGKQAVNDLMATLPVPQGLEYLPKTAQPVRLFASVDGKNCSAHAQDQGRGRKARDARSAGLGIPLAAVADGHARGEGRIAGARAHARDTARAGGRRLHALARAP